MEKYRPRPRRPDKALYVPKARRQTADDENCVRENSAAEIPSSTGITPIQSRPRNVAAETIARVHEHGENVDRRLSKSSSSKKEATHTDGEPVYTLTEADSLCDTVHSLAINENSLSPGSIESNVSASRIDSTAAVHSVSLPKEGENAADRSKSGSHRTVQRYEHYRRVSAESKEERDRARRKAQDKEKFRKSASCAAELKQSDNVHSPSLARLSSSTEQVTGESMFVCQQTMLGSTSISLHNSCKHEAPNIDPTTERQSAALFYNTDSTRVISTSTRVISTRHTDKDPRGQLTVCAGDEETTGNALLCEKQENIAERHLDSCLVVVVENELELAEKDNGTVVCVIEPCSRAADESSIDLKACPTESTKDSLDSMHERSANQDTAHIRLHNVSGAHRKGEVESEGSCSYINDDSMELEGRCSLTDSESQRASVEKHVLDIQCAEAGLVMESADLLPVKAAAECPLLPTVGHKEGLPTAETVPAVTSTEPRVAIAECPQLPPVMHQEQVFTAESVPPVTSVEPAVAEYPQAPSMAHKEQVATAESVPPVTSVEPAVAEYPQVPSMAHKEQVATADSVTSVEPAVAEYPQVPFMAHKEQVATAESVPAVTSVEPAVAEYPQVPSVAHKEQVATAESVPAVMSVEPAVAEYMQVPSVAHKEQVAPADLVPAVTSAEPLVLMEAIAEPLVAEQVPSVGSKESLPAVESAESALTGVSANCNLGIDLNCSDDVKEALKPNIVTGSDCIPEGSFTSSSEAALTAGHRTSHCVTTSETPDGNGAPRGVSADGDESWDSLFNDDGDCVDSCLLEELTSEEKNQRSPQESRFNYYDYEPKEPAMDDLELSHVIEIYDFPADFKTEDLCRAFAIYQKKGFDIKWVDDTHALGLFSSPITAREALTSNNLLVKVRPLSQATRASRVKARACADFLQPAKDRPETSAALARRLVISALGVRSTQSRAEREAERKKLQEARERRHLEVKQREDAWEGR